MAVEKRPRQKTRPSLVNRIVMGCLCMVFLGWIILTGWCLTIWISKGFDASFETVARLAARQAYVFEEFSTTSLATLVLRFIDIPYSNQASDAMGTAQLKTGEMADAALSRLGDFAGYDKTPLPANLEENWLDIKTRAHQFFQLSGAVARLLLIKLAIILAAIPLFVLAITAGLVDGLSMRAIRTASLGRESTYVFHKSIPLIKKTLLLVLGLWLAIPHALPPSPVFVGLAVLLGLVASVTASRFKKYL